MSALPQKKKTPEELEALRESLGISSEGPPPGSPGMVAPLPTTPIEVPRESLPIPAAKIEMPVAPVEEPKAKVESEIPQLTGSEEEPVVLESDEFNEPKAKPVRSLKRSERLPVERPKRVVSKESGKLPTRRHREGERIPLEKPTQPVSVGTSNLPTRKHSDQELARLRHAPLPGVEPPAVHVAKQTMGLLGLITIYALGLILMLVAGAGALAAKASRLDIPFDWLRDAAATPNFSMILFGIMASGVAVMLLGAAWIYFKKPMSQVHAALLTIIAVLVLVFGTLYFFPGLHGA